MRLCRRHGDVLCGPTNVEQEDMSLPEPSAATMEELRMKDHRPKIFSFSFSFTSLRIENDRKRHKRHRKAKKIL